MPDACVHALACSGMLTITLPWHVLVPDNAKYGVVRGKMILSAEYRRAKYAAHLRTKQQVRASVRLRGSVRMVATFHEPDRARVRDISNYSKLLCDAMSGAAYDDDGQIDDVRYIRGPVDASSPGVIIELSPLSEAHGS